jgi:hypothetical protein
MSRALYSVFACLLLASGCKTNNAANGADPRILIDLKKKCVEAGSRARSAYFAMHPACMDTLGAPRYTYNAELKTCLYADRCFSSATAISSQYFIMDAFSNSILVQYDVGSGVLSGTLPGLPAKSSGGDLFKTRFRDLFGPNAQAPSDFGVGP